MRADGFTGLPAGFTPFLDGAQKDTSLVVGIDGAFEQEEINLNADFSTELSDQLVLFFSYPTPKSGPRIKFGETLVWLKLPITCDTIDFIHKTVIVITVWMKKLGIFR